MPYNYSQASTDLGLGGSLNQQVLTETEEEKKKRLALQQQQKLLGGAGNAAQMLGLRGAGMGSPAGLPGMSVSGR